MEGDASARKDPNSVGFKNLWKCLSASALAMFTSCSINHFPVCSIVSHAALSKFFTILFTPSSQLLFPTVRAAIAKLRFPAANLALALASAIKNQIVLAEKVSAQAMSAFMLVAMLLRAKAFAMARVDAGGCPAFVMKIPLGFMATKMFPYDYMGTPNCSLPATHTYSAITIAVDRAQPQPTTGIGLDINLFLPALGQRAEISVDHIQPSSWQKCCGGGIFL
jgi:hypothetical protein